MLKSLLIKNFAIIDNLELNFSKGLNIITGETGAGKSIIVDALMMALGERASADDVRSGEAKAVIEATFEKTNFDLLSLPNDELKSIFDDFEISSNTDELIIRREIQAKGNSRCFINDTPATVSQLKLFGDFLVDFHGQHDHQLLLKPENHILILDDKANLDKLLSEFYLLIDELKKEIKNYQKLQEDRQNLSELTERYTQELTEIEQVSPKENEEEELENQLKKIENYEQIFYLVNSILQNLSEGNESVYNSLNQVVKDFEKLIKFESSFAEHLNEIKTSLISISEISNILRDYAASLDFDNEISADEIRLRLSKLKALRKKYGSYENIFQKREELKKNIEIVDNINFEIEKSMTKIQKLKVDCGKVAKKISDERKSVAKVIEDEIQKTLFELGMPYAKFKVQINQNPIVNEEIQKVLTVIVDDVPYEVFNNGIDKVEFLISTNKGEELKRLSEIASGGEISRVMLSIKSISSNKNNLPILIFDEIDIGISGRIARKVGLVMRNLSSKNQVIAITHLSQIASLADHHIHVTKFETNGRAKVNVSILKGQDRINEIARLISGETLTEASLKTAEELIAIN
ncbi:MAG: DNA repair protein RecN [Candidatus Kapabacteria bacterium]|nr:DNA repair protein RecN [Candidatus Kapabacteria bacterium]